MFLKNGKVELINLLKNILHHKNLWGSIIPMQLVGVYAISQIINGTAFPSWWIYTGIGYFCLAILGISAGYHRLFCHRSYQTFLPIKYILLWFAILAGQGSPIYWIGIHKGYHHRHADTDNDAHSPKKGFWHSYILWMFTMRKMSIRPVTYLLRDKLMVYSHRHYQFIFWISHLCLALIHFEVWLYLLGLASFLTLHTFLIQTSFTHLPWAGYKNFNLNNDSQNVPWLFPIILGECWHNNHHGDPKNSNFGSKKWWELDPTYWIIKCISK